MAYIRTLAAVALWLVGATVGYGYGRRSEATEQCENRGMQRLFSRDFSDIARIPDSAPDYLPIDQRAAAQNLAVKRDEVLATYIYGRAHNDYFAGDLAEAVKVVDSGQRARHTVEQACEQNSDAY